MRGASPSSSRCCRRLRPAPQRRAAVPDERAYRDLVGLVPDAVAAALGEEYARLTRQCAAAAAALDVLEQGAFVCDEHAALVLSNEAARTIFAQDDGVNLQEGRIRFRDHR